MHETDMKIAYIAGPYRADTINGVVQNIRKAEDVAIRYWKRGYAGICPHKNSALFDGILSNDVWLKGDLAILSKCDAIVMMKGWESSVGASTERDIAMLEGIEIIYD